MFAAVISFNYSYNKLRSCNFLNYAKILINYEKRSKYFLIV